MVRLYQETCAAVIQRYGGYIAQHVGDGLLVYFGYPVAHEDDAQRARRTGLEIIAALQSRARQQAASRPLPDGRGSDLTSSPSLQGKREMLALGETPNIAARLQGLAEPDTVVMSSATYRLVRGLFECQGLGPQTLKGISIPLSVYRVLGESTAQNRFEAAVDTGLTPLIGREEELQLLQRRWAQAKDGAGQVVLLNGEAGIGKSRLVQAFKEQVLTLFLEQIPTRRIFSVLTFRPEFSPPWSPEPLAQYCLGFFRRRSGLPSPLLTPAWLAHSKIFSSNSAKAFRIALPRLGLRVTQAERRVLHRALRNAPGAAGDLFSG